MRKKGDNTSQHIAEVSIAAKVSSPFFSFLLFSMCDVAVNYCYKLKFFTFLFAVFITKFEECR